MSRMGLGHFWENLPSYPVDQHLSMRAQGPVDALIVPGSAARIVGC